MKHLLSLLFFAFLVNFAAQAQDTPNVTGSWAMSVETDAGSGTPDFVLKQEGGKITGTYSGQLGDAPVTGTIKGNVIHLEFPFREIGSPMTAKPPPLKWREKSILLRWLPEHSKEKRKVKSSETPPPKIILGGCSNRFIS